MPPGVTEKSRTAAINDALVFRRALTAAIAGLIIQIALLVATGLTALWGDSQALYAAAWHMLGGLPIWIVLALIYQQHESERIQRLAANKLAERAATMAVGVARIRALGQAMTSMAMARLKAVSGSLLRAKKSTTPTSIRIVGVYQAAY